MAKQVYVFSAQLDGWKGVRRKRGDQTLADLHGAHEQHSIGTTTISIRSD